MLDAKRWPTIATWWAAICVVVTTASLVLHLAVFGPHDVEVYRFFYSDAVLGLTFPVLGAIVARAAPRNRIGFVLAAAGIVGFGAFAREWAYHGVVTGALPLATSIGWIANWAWVGYWLPPTFVPLLFPDGHLPSRRWKPVAVAIAAVLGASALAAALNPGSIDGIDHELARNPLGVGSNEAPFVAVQSTIALAVFIGVPLCLLAMVLHLRRAQHRRPQIQWLALGFGVCVGSVAIASIGVAEPFNDVLFALGFVAIVVCMTIAIVRHGLFDVERVLNRSVVYGILTGLGFALYVVAILVAGSLGRRELAPVIAAAVALAIASLRSRVQQLVDRTLFGYRSEPLAAIERLGASSDLHALASGLRETLRLPYVAIDPADGRPPVRVGTPSGGCEELPVVVVGRTVAWMSIGHRYPGERFTADEMTLLADATRRAAALLYTSELSAGLQRSRERLVIAREEERRRIRRDLHDGLGPTLAGMALQLDSLASRLNGDQDLVGRASRVRDRLQEAVTEVRRIVEDLGPGPVDELGFAEAIRQLEGLDPDARRVRVELAAQLPDLPAAVEEAAYRIAAEAVTNTLRHAGAGRCDVTVTASAPWLELHIVDDGSGFASDVQPGVGLTSITERTSEIGGTVNVSSAPGRGTLVVARLPLGGRDA